MLSAADSEIACLSAARRQLGDAGPSLRLANLLRLKHNLSVDLYLESVASKARLVIVRLLGGQRYWPYGVDELVALARKGGPRLALLSGDDQPDPERLRAAGAFLAGEPLAYEALLEQLLESGSEAVQDFTAFHVGELGLQRFAPRLAAIAAEDPSRADVVRARAQLDAAREEAAC